MFVNVAIRFLFTACAFAGFLCDPIVHAASFSVQTGESPVPTQVGNSIRGVLQSKAIKVVSNDQTMLELWPRQELPLKSKPSSTDSLAAIPETTLVAVISIQRAGLQDYKGNDIPSGTYTARFGLQPQDGDHLGTADFSTFLVLIPAESDKELGGIDKFKPMVKASGKVTPSGHPAILSLRPAAAAGALPQVTEPAPEHQAIRLKLQGKVAGSNDSADIVFDLVFQGKGHT
jgi:hypothetical protein